MKIQPDESYKQIHVGDILKYSEFGLWHLRPLLRLPADSIAAAALRIRADTTYNTTGTAIRGTVIEDPYGWIPIPNYGGLWEARILRVVPGEPVTQTRRLTVRAIT